MRGADIAVRPLVQGARDRLGNEVETWGEPQSVSNVLIGSPETADIEAARTYGYTARLTLHFPKTWTSSLMGALVELPAPWDGGNPYRVVGDPQPYMDANTPTPWNRPVIVGHADG